MFHGKGVSHQSPMHQTPKKFEEDASSSRNQSPSLEKRGVSGSAHKQPLSLKKEISQQLGTEDYQSDVESGFESNPKAQRQQQQLLSSQKKPQHTDTAHRYYEAMEHRKDAAERTDTLQSNSDFTYEQQQREGIVKSKHPAEDLSLESKQILRCVR